MESREPNDVVKWCDDLDESISKGDKGRILFLLEQFNVPSDIHNKQRVKLLHDCVVLGRPKVVAALIDAGCDVNAKNEFERTPLFLAICNNNSETVKVLIENGGRMDGYQNTTLMHMAASSGAADVIKTLRELGYEVKVLNNQNETPLYSAIQACPDLSLEEADGNGKRNKYLKTIKTLVELGADVNDKDHDKVPLLCRVIESIELVKLFIDFGARINDLRDKSYKTALDYAITTGNENVVKLLIESGSTLDSFCLRTAIKIINIRMVKLLLKYGAPVPPVIFYTTMRSWGEKLSSINTNDFIDYDNHFKMCFGRTDVPEVMISIMKICLSRGANINEKFRNSTPLDVAIENNFHSEIISFLLENGAKYNDTNLTIRRIFPWNKKKSKIPFLLIQHSIMTAAIDQDESSSNSINFSGVQYDEFNVKCKDEITLMKKKRVYNKISYFNILTDKKIGPYTRNEDIVDKLSKKDFTLSVFPIYGDMVMRRFDVEYKKQKLIFEAANSFNHIAGWDGMAISDLHENILQYLNENDLQNLASIRKSNN